MAHENEDPREQPPSEGADDGADNEPEGIDEDAAWNEIVSNFGDRAELPDRLPVEEDAVPQADPEPDARPAEPDAGWFSIEPVDLDGPDTYVPPPPPPMPKPSPDRALAWTGVLGAPVAAILLVILRTAFDISISGWVTIALVAAFLGGFGYLIATMPKDPGDPWDDGARV